MHPRKQRFLVLKLKRTTRLTTLIYIQFYERRSHNHKKSKAPVGGTREEAGGGQTPNEPQVSADS